SEKILHLSPFGFVTGCYAGDSSKIRSAECRTELHLLLDYTEGHRKDEYGVPIPLPEPHGMSGSGVWALPRPDVPVENWEFDQTKLVAIAQSIHTATRVLIATKFKYALTLLSQNRSDLRDSIRVSFPTVT